MSRQPSPNGTDRPSELGAGSIVPLVREVGQLVDRVRLLYLYPSDLDDALIDTLKDALVETWNAIGIPFASQQPAQAERSTKVTPLVVSQAGG